MKNLPRKILTALPILSLIWGLSGEMEKIRAQEEETEPDIGAEIVEALQERDPQICGRIMEEGGLGWDQMAGIIDGVSYYLNDQDQEGRAPDNVSIRLRDEKGKTVTIEIDREGGSSFSAADGEIFAFADIEDEEANMKMLELPDPIQGVTGENFVVTTENLKPETTASEGIETVWNLAVEEAVSAGWGNPDYLETLQLGGLTKTGIVIDQAGFNFGDELCSRGGLN